jgi:hypothetical protein
MDHKKEAGAVPAAPAPMFRSRQANSPSHSKNPTDRQPGSRHTAAITASVVAALSEMPEDDRPELMRWVASLGLLGVAHQLGFRAAAADAYRMADSFAAGAVQ